MDCFTKTVTFQKPEGKKIVFRGERNVISNCIVSAMALRKMIKRGYEAYHAYVLEAKRGDIQLLNNK